MRDLKFRAWDIRGKKMYNVTTLGLGEHKYQRTAVNHKEQPNTGYNKFYPDEVRVMQYTGLKDMNGVEIYEGDIVKCNSMVAIVEFLGGVFYGRNGTPLNQWYTKEVIGNVHENPELLQGEIT